jgi:hypothetical protein
MRTHDRNAAGDALPAAPNEFYSGLHGQGELSDLRVVPDRCAALLLEAEATCALAAEGHEIFGHWPARALPRSRVVARSSLVGSELVQSARDRRRDSTGLLDPRFHPGHLRANRDSRAIRDPSPG